MTHDELKIKLRDMPVNLNNSVQIYDALLAVIELHKPFKDRFEYGEEYLACSHCTEWTTVGEYFSNYPCQTIQAIEKEVNG